MPSTFKSAQKSTSNRLVSVSLLCIVCVALIFVSTKCEFSSKLTSNWLETARQTSMDVERLPFGSDMPEFAMEAHDSHGGQEEENHLTADIQSEDIQAAHPTSIKDKRDASSSKSSSDKKKKFKLLNVTGVRVALAIFGLIFLNMLAICIHHIYQKLTKSSNSYKSVEQNISPF